MSIKPKCLLVIHIFFTTTAFADDNLAGINLFSSEITFPLGNGNNVTAKRISGTDLGGTNFSWIGQLKGVNGGFASLAMVDDWLNGTIHLPEGVTYAIRGPLGELEVNSVKGKARACGVCKAGKSNRPDPRRQRRAKTWRNGDGNVVDVLFAYQSETVEKIGGLAALEAHVSKSIADSNLCFYNSRVDLQLRLVHLEEVSYAPTDDLAKDRDRLMEPNDGHLDNIHALRDEYGADLVTLITADFYDAETSGIASTMDYPALSFADTNAFSAFTWEHMAAPYYTFAHEIGHLFGCQHNREDPSSWEGHVFNAFSFGKRWQQGTTRYLTIMSYEYDDGGDYGQRIPYFSNPDVSYLGVPTGNAGSEDNAQVLSFTTPYLANFRKAVVQGIIPSIPYAEIKEGESKSFNVRLAAKPTSAITVTASITQGAEDNIFLSGPTSLTFDSGNWNLPHPLQVSARTDSDEVNGSAVVTLSATGMATATVSISETDVGSSISSGRMLSGSIRNSLGVGISAASLTFSNSGGSVITDGNGTFSHTLSSEWEGTVTPSKSGHVFEPTLISVSSGSGDSIGMAFSATRSNVLYVNAGATGSGDGSSWANAYADLDVALRAPHSFSEVWVAEGTYKPSGTARSAVFLLPPAISVYGGFGGTETSRSERNPSANLTILSGNLGANGNSYHIVIPAEDSVLDGFTIRDSNASGEVGFSNTPSGALWAEKVSFSIINCTFSENYANYDLGGNGSAVFLSDANATFESCTFSGNIARAGGAVFATGNSNLSFSNSRFLGNKAIGENDQGNGGVMALGEGTTSATFINCIFSGNSASNNGGVVNGGGKSTRFVNCSFSGNSANLGGVVTINGAESVSFENSILWGNTSTSGNDVYDPWGSGKAVASHSLFDPSQYPANFSVSDNLSSNPLFTDADGPDNLTGTDDDDLTLRSGSPAIDEASSSITGYSSTDLLGQVRSGAPDLGAYELQTQYSWGLAKDHGSGWKSFDWFGDYYETTSGWIYHANFGWLHRISLGTDSIWLYFPNHGWLWTSKNIHPFFYAFEAKNWWYFKSIEGKTMFFEFDANTWFSL